MKAHKAFVIMALVLSGCSTCRTGRSVIDDVQCHWSESLGECFCVTSVYTNPTVTWAPPQVCGGYVDDEDLGCECYD